MSEWIRCTKCTNRFKSFMTKCPFCGELVNNNSSRLSNLSKNKFQKKIININKNRKKIIIVSISISFFLVIGIIIFSLNFNNPQIPMSELKEYALNKINQDRLQYGLSPVQLSDNDAAQIHAQDLLKTETLSHWTTNGMKPYMLYSIRGGNDAISQNVAHSKYEIVSITLGSMIDKENPPSKDILDETRLYLCKIGIAICEQAVDPYKSIDDLEYAMMYDDWECCNDGHRKNILDKDHTHVSLGIAYNKFYFAIVQNFENKKTEWDRPISYNNQTGKVSMSGQIADNLYFSEITINYDPLPSIKTYNENFNRDSYDSGNLVAIVAPNITSQYPEEDIMMDDGNIIRVIDAEYENKDEFDSNPIINISFHLEKLIEKHGKGVYTVNTFYGNDETDIIEATSKAIFID